ncbi:uncharacterized protein LOC127845224 isoform X2 [Dreissena polymorpha]|uniref:uncharacterized protein LOC127845224 isoform X2 n=1 Tax=Dreissena polymorpha TaxID=45954 RepID=UPI00226519A8|nr:uncharacterized protein LOC127845224 isoform X2 [Dreissena polymorpha]
MASGSDTDSQTFEKWYDHEMANEPKADSDLDTKNEKFVEDFSWSVNDKDNYMQTEHSGSASPSESMPLSMPKNWMQVERLKQLQKQMMKQEMFFNYKQIKKESHDNTESPYSFSAHDTSDTEHMQSESDEFSFEDIDTPLYIADVPQLDDEKTMCGYDGDTDDGQWFNGPKTKSKLKPHTHKKRNQNKPCSNVKRSKKEKKTAIKEEIVGFNDSYPSHHQDISVSQDLEPLSAIAINNSLKTVIASIGLEHVYMSVENKEKPLWAKGIGDGYKGASPDVNRTVTAPSSKERFAFNVIDELRNTLHKRMSIEQESFIVSKCTNEQIGNKTNVIKSAEKEIKPQNQGYENHMSKKSPSLTNVSDCHTLSAQHYLEQLSRENCKLIGKLSNVASIEESSCHQDIQTVDRQISKFETQHPDDEKKLEILRREMSIKRNLLEYLKRLKDKSSAHANTSQSSTEDINEKLLNTLPSMNSAMRMALISQLKESYQTKNPVNICSKEKNVLKVDYLEDPPKITALIKQEVHNEGLRENTSSADQKIAECGLSSLSPNNNQSNLDVVFQLNKSVQYQTQNDKPASTQYPLFNEHSSECENSSRTKTEQNQTEYNQILQEQKNILPSRNMALSNSLLPSIVSMSTNSSVSLSQTSGQSLRPLFILADKKCISSTGMVSSVNTVVRHPVGLTRMVGNGKQQFLIFSAPSSTLADMQKSLSLTSACSSIPIARVAVAPSQPLTSLLASTKSPMCSVGLSSSDCKALPTSLLSIPIVNAQESASGIQSTDRASMAAPNVFTLVNQTGNHVLLKCPVILQNQNYKPETSGSVGQGSPQDLSAGNKSSVNQFLTQVSNFANVLNGQPVTADSQLLPVVSASKSSAVPNKTSPASVISSMDSYITVSKKKRDKTKPAVKTEKLKVEDLNKEKRACLKDKPTANGQMRPQKQKPSKSTSDYKSLGHEGSGQSVHFICQKPITDIIEAPPTDVPPVPFVDFPARIVITKVGNKPQIVASPLKVKSITQMEDCTDDEKESSDISLKEPIKNKEQTDSINMLLNPQLLNSCYGEKNQCTDESLMTGSKSPKLDEASPAPVSNDIEIASEISQLTNKASFKRKTQLIETYLMSNKASDVPNTDDMQTPDINGRLDNSSKTNVTRDKADSNNAADCIMKNHSIANMKSDESVQKSNCLSNEKTKLPQDSNSSASQPSVTPNTPSGKKFIKTKFIILKGEICDRWLQVKRRTGFGDMSDPTFVHYLLRLEEARQVHVNSDASCQGCPFNVVDGTSRPSSVTELQANNTALKTCTGVKRQLEGMYKVGCAPAKKAKFYSNATEKQMSWAKEVFRDFMREIGLNCTDFEHQTPSWINRQLCCFYMHARMLDGSLFSVEDLQTFRRALSLYLSSLPSGNHVTVSIAQDINYADSNTVLAKVMSERLLKPSFDDLAMPAVITNSDMEKLYRSETLSDKNPVALSWKVWFDIVYHLCRGKMPRCVLRNLKKQELVLQSDEHGVYYSFSVIGYLSDEQLLKMYATPGVPEKCPVRTTSLYISKLHEKCEALFQYPCRNWTAQISQWYTPEPVCRDKLDQMMQRISLHAHLSHVYSNESVIYTARRKAVRS